MNIRELLEKRATIVAGLHNVLDVAGQEKRDLSTREKQQWDAGLVEVRGLSEEIGRSFPSAGAAVLEGLNPNDRAAFLAAVEDRLSQSLSEPHRPEPTDDGPSERGGMTFRTAEGREVRALRPDESFASEMRRSYGHPGGQAPQLSVGRFVRALIKNDWREAQAEHRAMVTNVDTQGGFGVPAPLGDQIVDLARAAAVLFQAGALTIPMSSKTLDLVRVVADPSFVWKAEDTLGTLDTAMSLDRLTFMAKTLIALVPVSLELLQDAPNVAEQIDRSLMATLGAELDRLGLFGLNQGGGPPGLYGDPDLNVVSMGTNGAALTNYVPFIDALQKVREANGTPVARVYSPRTEAALAKLADTTTQPLRAPDAVAKLKELVSSRIPNNLTQGSANNASAGFVGDFSQVAYGVRSDITLEVSRDAGESFERARVLVRAYLRADCNVLRPKHLCRIVGIIP